MTTEEDPSQPALAQLASGDGLGALRTLDQLLLRPGRHGAALLASRSRVLAHLAKQGGEDASERWQEAERSARKACDMAPDRAAGWAALGEALEGGGGAGRDGDLGEAWMQLARVVEARGNPARGVEVALQAAEAFRRAKLGGKEAEALEFVLRVGGPAAPWWTRLAGVREGLGEYAAADEARFEALRHRSGGTEADLVIALLLARPCHAIVMDRRHRSYKDAAGRALVFDEAQAMDELLARVQRLETIMRDDNGGATFEDVFTAVRLLSTGPLTAFSVEHLVRLAASTKHEAVRARVLGVLAIQALDQGDVAFAYHAACQAEELEQRVLARAHAERGKGVVVIGDVHAPDPYSPTGSELHVVLATCPPQVLLTRARAGLACEALCGGTPQAIRECERLVKRVGATLITPPPTKKPSSRALPLQLLLHTEIQALEKHVVWLKIHVVACSRGPLVPQQQHQQQAIATPMDNNTVSEEIAALDLLLARRFDDALGAFHTMLQRPNAPWWKQLLAHQALLCLAATLAENGQHAKVELPPPPPPAHPGVMDPDHALGLMSLGPAVDVPSSSSVLLRARYVWARMCFGEEVNEDLEALLTAATPAASDDLPLAHEILGRFYMGLDRVAATTTTHTPAPTTTFLYRHGPRSVVTHPPPTTKKTVRSPPKAIKSLQRAAELDKLGLGPASALAEAWLAAKQEDKAAALYKQVLDALDTRGDGLDVADAQITSGAWAWFRMGELQLRHGKHPLGAASFSKALSRLSQNQAMADMFAVHAWVGLAQAHEHMGRLTASAEAFTKALEEMDRSTTAPPAAERMRVCLSLSRVHAKARAREEAVKYARQACALMDPAKADAMMREEAITALASALFERGAMFAVRGAAMDAQRDLVEVLSLCSSSAAAGFHPDRCKQRGDALTVLASLPPSIAESARTPAQLAEWAQSGLAEYVRAVHECPWDPVTRYDAARHFHVHASKLPRPATVVVEAFRDLAQSAVFMDPTDACNWLLLGSMRQDVPLLRQHCLVRALELDPDNSMAWIELGDLYLTSSLVGLARKAYSQAQVIDPQSPAAWVGHARCYENEGLLDKALQAYECAVACGVTEEATYEACLSLARMSAQQGPTMQTPLLPFSSASRDEVLQFMRFAQLALQCHRHSAEAWYYMGMACKQLTAWYLSRGAARSQFLVNAVPAGDSPVAAEAKQWQDRAVECFRTSAKLSAEAGDLRNEDRALTNVMSALAWPPAPKTAETESAFHAMQLAVERSVGMDPRVGSLALAMCADAMHACGYDENEAQHQSAHVWEEALDACGSASDRAELTGLHLRVERCLSSSDVDATRAVSNDIVLRLVHLQQQQPTMRHDVLLLVRLLVRLTRWNCVDVGRESLEVVGMDMVRDLVDLDADVVRECHAMVFSRARPEVVGMISPWDPLAWDVGVAAAAALGDEDRATALARNVLLMSTASPQAVAAGSLAEVHVLWEAGQRVLSHSPEVMMLSGVTPSYWRNESTLGTKLSHLRPWARAELKVVG